MSTKVTSQEVAEHFAKRRQQGLELGLDMNEQIDFAIGLIGKCDGPVLDVGTGKARVATKLAAIAPHVMSIDPSDEEREFAKIVLSEAGVADRVTLIGGTGNDLPFDADTFCATVSQFALHHFEDPAAVLREMVRVTKPGGVVLASDFDHDGFDVIEAIHQSEGRHHPVEGWPTEKAADYLREVGCGVELIDGPKMKIALARVVQG